MEPEDLAVIGHTGDLLVDIYARNLTHIYILPQCSTTAARVLNPAGMDAQFERLRCAISRGILIKKRTGSLVIVAVTENLLSLIHGSPVLESKKEGVPAPLYVVTLWLWIIA